MDDVEVISPDGVRGTVPSNMLMSAAGAGYKEINLAKEDDSVEIYSPQGVKGLIPRNMLSSALESKYTLEQPGESYLTTVIKSALKGPTSIADIPKMVGSGLEFLSNTSANKEPYPMGTYGVGIRPDIEGPQTNYASYIPDSGDARNLIKTTTGLNLEPNPTDSTGRILSNAAEFAGSMTPWGFFNKASKLKNAVKMGASGALMGTTSGVLKEEGVNPLLADVGTSLFLPAANATRQSLFSKFSKAGREKRLNDQVSKALREQVGEENLPSVMENIDQYQQTKSPIDLSLTTAEIAQDPGLSKLYRTQSNSPALTNRNIENTEKLSNALESIGTTGLPESVKGEAIRNPFVDAYNKNIKLRSEVTKPLYNELEALQSGIIPENAKRLLDKEIGVASPGNISALERYRKHLGDDVTAPKPIQLENTIQELGDKSNAFARTGEANKARKFRQIKEAYEKDLATNPIGLQHRQEYKRLSEPLNEIDNSSLLSNFVKQNKDVNKMAGFVVPSEKIPTAILNADLANTKLLMKKTQGNKETLDLVKGTYIDKLLETAKLKSGNFSYNKAENFLNNKYTKEKIKIVFNKQEQAKLNQFLDVLKKRNKLENMGKMSGSDTHQKLKVEQDFSNALSGLGKISQHAAIQASGTGILGTLGLDALKNRLKADKYSRYNNVLEGALVDPSQFKGLMSGNHQVKGFSDFYNPVPALATTGINYMKERE